MRSIVPAPRGRGFSLLSLFRLALCAAVLAAPAHAWDQWASEVIDFSSEYSTGNWSARQALHFPNVESYGDHGSAWAPESMNGTTEFIAVGFREPVYADGVTIRENSGNGFVTKVEVRDTNGAYHQVWAGQDPSQPGSVVDFKVTFPRTAYLVRGVRVTIDTDHDPDTWEEIDAIELHGQPLGDFQWASHVVDFSSQYGDSPGDYSAEQALGKPDVPNYGDDGRTWTASSQDGTVEFLTLGFQRPVYAYGVAIRETSGNGFVTKIEAKDLDDTYHEVWAGVDPSPANEASLTFFDWPQTPYAVDSVRITIDTSHTDEWEEIDAVYIRGASASAPAPTITAISPASVYRESSEFTLTVTGAGFLASSVVRWNGTDRATTFVSATELRAAIPAGDLTTPGVANITVYNVPPGGGASNAAPLTIEETYAQWAASVLNVTSEYGESPDSYSAARVLGPPDVLEYGDDPNAWATERADMGLQSITLGYERAVYANGARVRESNANGFVRRIEVLDMAGAFHTVWAGTDDSPSGDLADLLVGFAQTPYAVRGLRVTVDTDHVTDDWEEIDAVQLLGVPVTSPAPAITSLGPNPALRGGPGFPLVVNGTGFAPNSVVRWNGADRPTTFVSPTRLTVAVTAADVATNGTASLTVFSPAPGGGTSAPATLTIGPARYGDVDGDNAVTFQDVATALRIAAGFSAAPALNGGDVAPEYPESADGYGDKRIGLDDALRIARFLYVD